MRPGSRAPRRRGASGSRSCAPFADLGPDPPVCGPEPVLPPRGPEPVADRVAKAPDVMAGPYAPLDIGAMPPELVRRLALVGSSIEAIFWRIGAANGACTASSRLPASSATSWVRWVGSRRKHFMITASRSGVTSGRLSMSEGGGWSVDSSAQMRVKVGRSKGGRPPSIS